MIHYEKRKNKSLFKKFKELQTLKIETIQNYIPIYNSFFNFKENKEINLNHKNYITSISENNNDITNDNDREFSEKIFDIEISDGTETKNVKTFLKLGPVIEPSKFLVGKYNIKNEEFYQFPDTSGAVGHKDFYDTNNISYVDSLFSFLSSQLLNKYHFVNAVDFYGSFLANVTDFKLNVSEDIEYYLESDFFMKNKNKLFRIEDYDKELLNIVDEEVELEFDSLEEICGENPELIELSEANLEIDDSIQIEQEDSDSCSSNSSHTSQSETQSEMSIDSDESYTTIDENVNIIFDKYIVQITSLEHCNDTMDNLVLNKQFNTDDEWFSCLFQIIMTLIAYQDAFSFTHNDLHTNNVMFNHTEEEFLYYLYKGIYYKVPTYGRIFKIIDFGRSIYTIKNTIFCSNSFQPNGDAATQYNTEPYFNEKKKRIDPNKSFDLCRLACSIWDNLLNVSNVENVVKLNSVARIIDEWCKDDKGVNVLYKRNGEERYPNFKLYKMIARTVHKHTPHNQLNRKEFKKYQVPIVEGNVINLDNIPSFTD